MGNLLAILGLMGLSLLGWAANFYLLAQVVLARRRGRPHRSWSVPWGAVWAAFVSGLLVWASSPADSSWQAGYGSASTLLVPILWLGALWLFRRSRRPAVEDAGAGAVRHHQSVGYGLGCGGVFLSIIVVGLCLGLIGTAVGRACPGAAQHALHPTPHGAVSARLRPACLAQSGCGRG